MCKIGILVNNIDAKGGCEIVSLRLSDEMTARGIENDMISIRPTKNPSYKSLNINPVRRHTLSDVEIFAIQQMIIELELDFLIVQVDGMMSPIFDPKFINKISTFLPIYLVIHNSPASFVKWYGFNGDYRPYSVLKSLKHKLYNNAYCKRRCNAIIDKNITYVTLTKKSQDELKKYCGLESVVIENVIPSSKTKFIQEKKENIVLYLGRIDNQQKNIVRLINAWKRSCLNDWSLLIVGDGPDFRYIKKRIATISNCRMVGSVDNVEAQRLIAKAKVLILTSNYEGFPTVFTEAMLNDTAIISTRFDGFPNDYMIHMKNCYLVDRSDKDVTEALRTVCYNDELIKTLSIEGRKTVKDVSRTDPVDKWMREVKGDAFI